MSSQSNAEFNGQSVQIKSLWTILAETLVYYRQYGCSFTRILLAPIGQITLALYVCIILLQGLANFLIQRYPGFIAANLGFIIILLLLIALGGTFWVIRGGWHYVVYWASLNINASEAIEGKPLNFKAAYQVIARQKKQPYQMLVLVYSALPLLTCLPLLLAPLLMFLLKGGESGLLGLLIFLAGCLLSVIVSIGWLIAAVFLSFIFQIAAFEPISINPLSSFLRSARLVLPRFGIILALQAILMIATNYLLNLPVVLLLRLLQLSRPLDSLHQWLLETMLEGVHPSEGMPYQAEVLGMIQQHLPELASSITDSIFMLLITALLLPLGTFAFTLLYRDNIQALDAKK